jgi:hypothetical protein
VGSKKVFFFFSGGGYLFLKGYSPIPSTSLPILEYVLFQRVLVGSKKYFFFAKSFYY